MNERLLQQIAEEDRRLEQVVEADSAELAKYRWHWTKDESNPERMGFSAYGRVIGKAESTVRLTVRAYENWAKQNSSVNRRTFNEVAERERMGSETEVVVEAVANARERSIATIRQTKMDEVKQVRHLARDRAEEKGTTVEEEAKQVALNIVRAEKAIETGDARAKEIAQRSGLGFMQLEAELQVAKRDLIRALHAAEKIGLEEDQRAYIESLIDGVREVCNLIQGRISGTVTIDWDSELLAIAGKEI